MESIEFSASCRMFILARAPSIGLFGLGRTLNLFFRFTGWSTSWLVGAVVMIVGARGVMVSCTTYVGVNRVAYVEVWKALGERPVPPWRRIWKVADLTHDEVS